MNTPLKLFLTISTALSLFLTPLLAMEDQAQENANAMGHSPAPMRSPSKSKSAEQEKSSSPSAVAAPQQEAPPTSTAVVPASPARLRHEMALKAVLEPCGMLHPLIQIILDSYLPSDYGDIIYAPIPTAVQDQLVSAYTGSITRRGRGGPITHHVYRISATINVGTIEWSGALEVLEPAHIHAVAARPHAMPMDPYVQNFQLGEVLSTGHLRKSYTISDSNNRHWQFFNMTTSVTFPNYKHVFDATTNYKERFVFDLSTLESGNTAAAAPATAAAMAAAGPAPIVNAVAAAMATESQK